MLASVILFCNTWYPALARAESPASPSSIPSKSPTNTSPTNQPKTPSETQQTPKPQTTKEVSQFRRIEFRRPEAKTPAIASPGSPITAAPGANSQPTIPKQLTLLVPSTESEPTIASHPTLFAYIPQAGWVEFVLMEANTARVIYAKKLVVQAPGIVQMTIPKSAPALAIDKTYWWYFSVVEDPKHQRDASYVQGRLQRVEVSTKLRQQLAQATPGELPAIYAEAGLWYETLTTLAELRRTYPQDVRLVAAWSDLLTQNGLNSVATAALIEGTTPPSSTPTSTSAPLKSPAPPTGDDTRVREIRQPEYRVPGRAAPGRRDGGGTR